VESSKDGALCRKYFCGHVRKVTVFRRVRVGLRFSVWLVISDYLHVIILFSVVVVTLPNYICTV